MKFTVESSLRFDGAAAYEEFVQELEQVVLSLVNTVLANAHANLGGQYLQVQSSLIAGLVDLGINGWISGEVSANHWKAFIAEWGSGSEMDLSNPGLAAYMSSGAWNPMRDGTAITGRPKGPYLGFDGQMYDPTGRLAGQNLEELRQYSWFQKWMEDVGITDPSTFRAEVPLHFMRDALLSNGPLIMGQLHAVVEKFSFGKFFS